MGRHCPTHGDVYLSGPHEPLGLGSSTRSEARRKLSRMEGGLPRLSYITFTCMTHSSDKPSLLDFGSDRKEAKVRTLTHEEIVQLRQDMAESSAWVRVELKHRRVAKNQKNSEYGIDEGIK